MPAFGGETLAQMADAGEVVVDGVALAFTTDSYVVKPLRFPGGSIGDLAVNGTVNDLAVSGAQTACAHALARARGRARRRTCCEPRWRRSPKPRPRAGVEIVAGDTKVVERGHADGMYVCTAGIGRRDPRAALSPSGAPARRPHHPVGEHRRARHGDHARAERVRARRGDRVGHPLAVAGGRRAARGRRPRAALHPRRDPGRGGLGAERAGPGVGCRDGRARERRPGASRRWPGRRRSSGSTRCTWPTRASWSRSSHPRRRRRRWRRFERCRAARRRPRSVRCETEPPSMVLVETSFGGRRVMDQLVGDPLPRIC